MTRALANELAMAVKVMCDVRLACTILMVVAIPVQGLGWEVMVAVGFSLVLSFVLLRYWDPLGARLMSGWWFPAVESLIAILLFVQFGSSGLSGAYLGATLALLACAGGFRAMVISLGAFVPIVALGVVGVFPALGGGNVSESVWLLSLVVLQIACSIGGWTLRTAFTSRLELVEQRRVAEVAEASGRERLRLAQELHDGVSKTLHGCHMIADSMARQLTRENHSQAGRAQELAYSLEVARQESRDLLYELRQMPPADITPYLRKALGQWADANPDIRLITDFGDAPVTVPVRTRHEMLRVVGELMENVRRHSGSSEVEVSLAVSAGEARLAVADSGVGMDSCEVSALKQDGHFGLAGVRERVALVRGTCQIDSGSGGTRVEIGFPVMGDRERMANEDPGSRRQSDRESGVAYHAERSPAGAGGR